MFSLTHKERKVFLLVGVILLLGVFLKARKTNPSTSLKTKLSSAVLLRIEKDPFSPRLPPQKKEKININTASFFQLQKLPYIGEKIAQRIIDYRRRGNRFSSLGDLRRIKGLKDKKIKAIAPYIVF